jgi:hypothetical protein
VVVVLVVVVVVVVIKTICNISTITASNQEILIQVQFDPGTINAQAQHRKARANLNFV